RGHAGDTGVHRGRRTWPLSRPDTTSRTSRTMDGHGIPRMPGHAMTVAPRPSTMTDGHGAVEAGGHRHVAPAGQLCPGGGHRRTPTRVAPVTQAADIDTHGRTSGADIPAARGRSAAQRV